jgi:hypothetical protein
MKEEIIEGFEEQLAAFPDKNKTRFEIIAYIISDLITDTDECFNRSVLWSFVNLQRRIGAKSENRQKIIDLWTFKRGNSLSLLSEMRDIYKTQDAIRKYREWIDEKSMPCLESETLIEESDKNLSSLQESVSYLIALA